jgi:hypothetical protein
VILDHLLAYRDYVLSFVIVDQIQILQRGYHVLFLDARHFTNFTVSQNNYYLAMKLSTAQLT